MEPGARAPQELDPEPAPGDPARPSATSRLRLIGYAAILVALAFSQAGGRMVADTKFDLVTDPTRFLLRGLRLWDPIAAFGQVQNQAYGYAWPMGPFFILGDMVRLPEWAIQRSWWALLLCLAFFGILRLAQRLDIGTPLTQVVAAFAFVLTPRITTLLGSTSIEVWPMALAPWVLLPLIRGSETGAVRRAAATSALVVACCGGVNAIAVAAVLPLGVIWIVTRAPGPRRRRMLGWWVALTALATFWWSGPLLLLGKYAPPFLDYIENATITTVPTDLARTLLGVSDWVAYFAGYDFPAGRELVATPFLLLDAAAIAALGLLGLALRGTPHQRFLILGVLTGTVLVGLGYATDVHGFFAADRQHSLDGALAPLRNLHKFDVVLRIPLILGVAHALTRLPALIHSIGSGLSVLSVRVLRMATALVLIALVLPWVNDTVAPSDGVEQVPGYWYQVADYLASHPSGTALEVPASGFGVYTWGNVHDDIMQGLARSPWAVRNVVPLAQPGNVVMLDKVTSLLESGHPGTRLASYLAENGVSHLIVRNDLDRLQTASPDPAYIYSMLASTPGISLARSFGPKVGDEQWRRAPNRVTRLVTGDGLAVRTGSVDVYDVEQPDQATLTTGAQLLVGDPGSGLDAGLASSAGTPMVLAADTSGTEPGQLLTDDMKRREMNFSTVRWNQSATMSADAPYRLVGPEHAHRVVADQSRWETTQIWTGGVGGVFASSSEAFADALPPLQIGSHPGAALDDDPATAWQSARHLDPTGQWWEVDFVAPRPVSRVTIGLAVGSAKVPKLRISMGGRSVLVTAPVPGTALSYDLALPAGRSLRITAAGRDLVLPGSFSLSTVRVADLDPQRFLNLPAPDPRTPVDEVAVSRDPERRPCVLRAQAFVCTESLTAPGEDGDTLARFFRVSTSDFYQVRATASLRRSLSAGKAIERRLGISLSASKRQVRDVASSPLAMVDADPATTWLASGAFPKIRITLPRTETVRSIQMTTNDAAAASRPTQLLVTAGRRSQVVPLDASGLGVLPGWRTRSLTMVVRTTERAFQVEGSQFVEAPAGVSELRINGERPVLDPAAGITFPCGVGPEITIGERQFQTRVDTSLSTLVRGNSVALETCSEPSLKVGTAPTELLALPTGALRVDNVTLTRNGAPSPSVVPVDVRRTASLDPSYVELSARSAPSLLALPQNFNAGWRATLDGKVLPVQRVDGWKQGWLIPAGPAATVRFSYTPAHLFTLLLWIGAGLALLVLLAALPLRLRGRKDPADLPALLPARPAVLDLVVALAAGGLLAGWFGLVAAAVAVILGLRVSRFGAWGPLAGVLLVVASLALTWNGIKDASWAVEWSQIWSVLAVTMLIGALAALRRAPAEVTDPE